MKANELMIGDWVRMPFGLPEIRQIKYPSEIDDADFYEPIPLTAEILEKNGWEKSSITDYKWSALYEGNRLPDMWEDVNKHYLVTIGLIDVNINYVHELQHAFRLCGIDKTIEL